MSNTRNAAERALNLRTPVPTPPAAPATIEHAPMEVDAFDPSGLDIETAPVDFGITPETADDISVSSVVDLLAGEEVEKSPHEDYVLTHQVNSKGEPGSVVTFHWPLKNGAGDYGGKKLFLRRPRMIDHLRLQGMRLKDGSRLDPLQHEAQLFAMLTGVLAEEILSLYDFDYGSLQFAYVGFTERLPRRS